MSISTLTARVNTDTLMPWLGGAAMLLMLALLAWLGANIFWTFTAPQSARPSAPIETDLQRILAELTERHLFGVHVVAAPVTAPSSIRLNGVIAAQRPGHPAYALLVVDGKPPQLVREGDEIVAGVVLQRVEARQIEILRAGQTQILVLPESGKPQTATSKVASADQSPAVEPAKAVASPPTSRRKFRRNPEDDET